MAEALYLIFGAILLLLAMFDFFFTHYLEVEMKLEKVWELLVSGNLD